MSAMNVWGITVVLVILKLVGVIEFSWWWVFCLIWLPIAAFVAVALSLLVVGLGFIAAMIVFVLLVEIADRWL